MEECHSDMVPEIQKECVLSKAVLINVRNCTYPVQNPVKPQFVDKSIERCHGWRWGIWETVNGEQKLTTESIENIIMMVPFSATVILTFRKKIGNRLKKILCFSGNIAFKFSLMIEILQLLLRLGTFQLSDIFYNTVGGVLGGLMYYVMMKVRKRI